MEQREAEAQARNETLEEEIAAAIALLLAGLVGTAGVRSLMEAVATLLDRLPLADLPAGESSEPLRRRIANLIVRDRPRLSGRSQVILEAHLQNLLYRAHYAINALYRVSTADDTRKGFAAERRFFTAHREAERRRLASSRMLAGAMDLYGPVLSWHHGDPKEPRVTHEAADRHNFDARSVPVSTGAMPGVLPNCTCTVGAPIQGARMLR